MISKFRFFDGANVAQADAKEEIQNYLDVYTSGPLTKATMLDRIAEGRPVDANFSNNFRIKRMGRDKDDLFWTLGKIHGLENLAYVDPEELRAAGGDPWRIQQLVNKVNDQDKPLPAQSFDKLVEEIHSKMDAYRAKVDNTDKGREHNPSDRKKLLGLPFLMSKRAELPEPKKGQKEWDIFYAMFGTEWDQHDAMIFDKEEKITEFNFENFIPKHLLSTMDTQSADFKNLVKSMNLYNKTKYEQHKQNQQDFKKLMPTLRSLNADETEILLHLLKNKNRTINESEQRTHELVDRACSNSQKEALAKLSEESNFAMKNRYKLQKEVMNYADKKKMPIDQMKVKDMLRHQHIVRDRIHNEVGTYKKYEENTNSKKKQLK